MKLPHSYNNWLSLIGSVIAIISLFMIGFLFVVSVILDQGSSYLGLFTYIILPVFLIIGLLLIPIGMWRKIRRERKSGQVYEKKWPRIDFNESKQRRATVIFGLGSVLFLLLSAIGSYEAFHYTESVEFCGKLCHKVMKPEYVAYQNSPHARVACVTCHVGPGADWYVRSKMSGLYQVYAVTTGNYPKPITTPVSNLRPARETCEQCHWPEKFYARQLIAKKHYLADENNTEWDINLNMKVGPKLSALGLQEGIHWHINPDVKIEYIATTEKRDTIPWVKYTNLKTGEEIIYVNEDFEGDPSTMEKSELRTMDCMDCHNRPSHDYRDPVDFIDDALTRGAISKDLPDIKIVSMDVLNKEFSTTDSAMEFIEQEVNFYYDLMYPEILDTSAAMVEQAIATIQEEFKKNIFPEMKVRWDVYPNHLGHVETDGCHRCHDDKHVSKSNHVISRDCNICHDIISQGYPGQLEYATKDTTLEFRHPVDIGEAWKTTACAECHFKLY
ncbi:MAG: NapC/NirT family cytochrome c [Bacteroidota bacterium]|nr:NapC/NirT family cytochrome c [Bacteroidota bacterium]